MKKYILMGGVLLFTLAVTPVFADSLSINFESPTYLIGSINGQDGWSSTGAYDQGVVSSPVISDSQSFRLSNAVTSGSFGDQTFSKSLVNEAGEADSTSGGMSGGTRQSHFEAQFDFASTQTSQQPGLSVSVSPDRGDGSRMSYLRFDDMSAGIDVTFYDVQGENAGLQAANFVSTPVATGLSRSTKHTAKFVIDYVDGKSNDVVKIYIDGSLVHTGTTWENYYRFDTEASAEQTPRTTDDLLFRAGGTAAPANTGNGFLFDNLSLLSSTPVVLAAPNLIAPANNSYVNGVSLTNSWSSVSGATKYIYESYNNSTATSLRFHGEYSTTSKTATNVANTTFWWRVKAADADGNVSDWSELWKVTVDNNAPAMPTGLKFQSLDRTKDFACGDTVPLQVAIPNWDDITGDPSFDHYEYTSFWPDGHIGLNEQVLNVAELDNSWMPPADGAYGYAVRSVDKAGNKSAWALTDKTLAGSCQIIYDSTPPVVVPTAKDQCKNNGWQTLKDAPDGKSFKNQGDCVSFVATKGKNTAAGQ